MQNCLHLAARQDLPPDMREKYFDMTKSELDRLMSTVQRMLDFYRPNLEREKVNLIDILDHVLILLHTQLNNRDIRVTSAWPASIPEIMAVRNQIQQVFINLILNAYDAMPDGGELMINVQQIGKASRSTSRIQDMECRLNSAKPYLNLSEAPRRMDPVSACQSVMGLLSPTAGILSWFRDRSQALASV